MKKIVNKLVKLNKTISTMESCTGGYLASTITDIDGSSDILKFSAVTYSNDFKIRMGVDKSIIEKYSVYSLETAMEMSKKISDYTNSNYAVGITGKLNKVDKNNLYGTDNKVFLSIYDKDNDKYYTNEIFVTSKTRRANKKEIVKSIVKMLKKIIK